MIGIDPGANGGIAVFVPGEKVKAVKMPKDINELSNFLGYLKDNYKPIVFLEKLNVRADDVAIENGQINRGKMYRIQKLLANFEQLRAIIAVSDVPYILVHPMTWQSKLKLRTKGVQEEKAERKRRYQQFAAEQYKDVKVTLWNADALLLMHFGRWALVNNISWIRGNLPEKQQQKLFRNGKDV